MNFITRRKESPSAVINPFQDVADLSTRMNQLLNQWPSWSTLNDKELLATTDWAPAVNVSESPEAYMIQAELPGVEKKDVHITLEDGVLSIAGEREQKREEKSQRYHRVECAYGHFLRRFTLPDDVVAEKIDATFKDGVLNLKIARSPSRRTTSKEIPIQ